VHTRIYDPGAAVQDLDFFVDAKHISLVAVAPLFERSLESDARLDGQDATRPGIFFELTTELVISYSPSLSDKQL